MSESAIEVRPLSECDMPALLRMVRREAEFERLTDGFAATEQRLRETLFAPTPAAEVLIAWVGNEAVGFAVFFTTFSTFQAQRGMYLEDLFVEEAWRGRGVGRVLMAHLAAIAIARGYGSINWSVLRWNESAIRFYRSIGAEQLDAWDHFHLAGDALRDLAAADG